VFLGVVDVESTNLAGRHELERSQGNLEIGSVGLEIIESSRDAGLKLGWVLARWARGRDLVEGAHVGLMVVDEFETKLRSIILCARKWMLDGARRVSEP
jgi:hypothetical protein